MKSCLSGCGSRALFAAPDWDFLPSHSRLIHMLWSDHYASFWINGRLLHPGKKVCSDDLASWAIHLGESFPYACASAPFNSPEFSKISEILRTFLSLAVRITWKKPKTKIFCRTRKIFPQQVLLQITDDDLLISSLFARRNSQVLCCITFRWGNLWKRFQISPEIYLYNG